jgi:hypothetical protein
MQTARPIFCSKILRNRSDGQFTDTLFQLFSVQWNVFHLNSSIRLVD